MTAHIAYLTGEYPRATDTFIQREVAALRALGLEVDTCTIRRTGPEHHVGEEQRQEAARTFSVLDRAKNPAHLLRCHIAAIARAPKRYFRALKLAWDTAPDGARAHLYQMIYFAEAAVLAHHLRARGVTHLHNHIAKASCTVAMLMSELSGIPYSFTLHGPDIFFEPKHWRLDEKIKRAAFVACISEFCCSQAMAFSDATHWERLHIVHCAITPDRYISAPRAHGSHLLFVGRLAAVKGLPVLFDALQNVNIPDLRLSVIGDGPDRAALETKARELGLSNIVDFLGYRSQSDVAEILGDTDILVLPSFAEGVPVVLMEAMAAQVPVVTTRIAGIPELIEDGKSGLLCPPGDPVALSTAICAILADPNMAANMGDTGRAKVIAEFNTPKEAARLAHLFTAYAAGETPPKRSEIEVPQ